MSIRPWLQGGWRLNKLNCFFSACFLLLSLHLSAQTKKFPAVLLKTTDGRTVSTDSLFGRGTPVVISFWATWCKPCITELTAIAEHYEEWQKELGITLLAISIDDARNAAKVAPFVNGRGWSYDVYLDLNGDLKRAMDVNMVPHTFILNGNGEIVWQHNAYAPGDEEQLYEELKKIIPLKN